MRHFNDFTLTFNLCDSCFHHSIVVLMPRDSILTNQQSTSSSVIRRITSADICHICSDRCGSVHYCSAWLCCNCCYESVDYIMCTVQVGLCRLRLVIADSLTLLLALKMLRQLRSEPFCFDDRFHAVGLPSGL